MFGAKDVDPNTVAVYIRWSTDEQGNGTTLDVQKESCQKFMAFKGWTYREDLTFIDDGYSGGNLYRPAMTELRGRIQAGQVKCVVVYKLDRLSRSLLDTVTLVRQEWADKCSLYSTQEDFNTNSAVGQMIFNILVSFAEFERNIIYERTFSGKRKRAQSGRNAGQVYPFGYMKGGGGGYTLDGWDDEKKCFTGAAAIVRRIFDDYLSGLGVVGVAKKLRDDNIPSPKGGLWKGPTIRRILTNKAYCGTYSYGVTKRERKAGGSRCVPGADPITVEAAIPAIVSKEEFDRAQEIRQGRAELHPRSLASDYLLTGILRCGCCGRPLTGSKGAQKRYYKCVESRHTGACSNGFVDAEALEQQVMDGVKKAFAPDSVKQRVEVIQTDIEQKIQERAHVVKGLAGEVSKLRASLEKVEQDYLAGTINAVAYGKLSAKLETALADATERLRAGENDLAEATATSIDGSAITEMAAKLDAWDSLSVDEVKQLLRDAVQTITVVAPKAGKGQRKTRTVEVQVTPRIDLFTCLVDTAAD